MKKFLIIALFFSFALALSGCAKKGINTSGDNKPDANKESAIKGDVGNDICKEFSADFVYSATDKPVVKVEPDWAFPALACRFYFTYDEHFYKGVDNTKLSAGGLHIFMMLENRNAAKQKEANEFLGLTVKTDSQIKMENNVNYRKDGSLYDIRLIINPNRYLRMDSNKGLTDDELIQFAAKVAEKIQGNLSFNIKSNPVDTEEVKPEEAGASQEAITNSFLNNLAGKKIDDALKMMDANDNTKEMWRTNFNTLESLKIKKMEEAFKEEWTATRQTFKAELDVKVNSEGEQMGWQNGTNYRWITLEKSASGEWKIHEIANNP